MTTASFSSATGGGAHGVRGATALSSVADDTIRHSRHRLGDALRALRVFGTVAAEVVLLGKVEDRPIPGQRHQPPPQPPPPTVLPEGAPQPPSMIPPPGTPPHHT